MTLKAPIAKKQTTSHKKRVGNHHNSTKHYHKAYWPYLPILVIVFVGALLSSTFNGQNFGVLGYSTNVQNATLLDATNVERKQDGVDTLTLNSTLSEAAQKKADDMVARNYWSHNTPDGKEPWTFFESVGYKYNLAGENLAYGFRDSQATIDGWMNSRSHRENLLKKDFQEVGFGIASSPNYVGSGPETIIVAMYARPASNVVSFSASVPETVQNSQTLAKTTAPSEVRGIARVELLGVSANSSAIAVVSVVAILGAAIVILRHSVAWHKRLAKGEQFILHHPLFDIAVVGGIVVAATAMQTVGFIH